ncbi:winged helix-turn-helix domain-containing protein [Halorussus halophilus]|uniref:winged helix-turn-helix domain-containing protein n=1 Tax=Halorussus halophilus TaxID=2650975 RepID=UPI0013016F2A|nr:helix-turn-helix domain-containing protein [Halorussus halophilus]
MGESFRVETEGKLDPDDAFTLLADETRLRIVRALGDAADPMGVEPIPFSELRRRAGIEESGRFNYHLGELVGHFVEQRDEGYRLRFPGVRVYQSMRAGTYTEDVTIPRFDLDAACHVCDGAMQGRYDNFIFKIDCPDCESDYYHRHLPPSSLAPESKTETLRIVDQRIRDHLSTLSNRICPYCAGQMPPHLFELDEDHRYGGEEVNDVLALQTCDHCGAFNYTRVGAHLLFEPAVVSFCYERDVDLSERRVWAVEFVSSDNLTEVLEVGSEDDLEGWRVAVDVEAGGETLRVVVDGSLDVVEMES